MRDRSLDQRGIAWVKADGRRLADMPVEAFHGNGMVSQLEILRGDLADVLYEATAADADYRFDTRITELARPNQPSGNAVRRHDGARDLVVGADGPHSTVRRLAFGPEEQFVRPLGGYNAWFTAPDTVGLDGWYLMYQAPGGLNVSMRPSHDPAKAKAGLAFRSEPINYDRGDLDEQRGSAGGPLRRRGLACRCVDRRRTPGRRLLLRRVRPGPHGRLVVGTRRTGRGRRLLCVAAERDGHQPGAGRGLCVGGRARPATGPARRPPPWTATRR